MPTKFDFLSPGIELREIDQSAIAAVPENDGLLLIGRAKKGPAMKPIKITSLTDFQAVFGTPMDGVKRGDPWREGNTGGGGWAAYAAEAYLASGVGPVKFIRLAGVEESAGEAGWSVGQSSLATPIAAEKDVKGALGIFVASNEDLVGTTAASANFTFSDYQTIIDNSVMTIQYVDAAGATQSFTVEFYDTDAGAPLGTSTVEIGLDYTTTPSAQDFRDAFVTAGMVGSFPASSVTAANGSGANDADITMVKLGTIGDSKTITTTFTTSATFGGGADTTPINGVLGAILYTSGSNLVLSGNTRDNASGNSVTDKTATAIIEGTNGWTASLQGASGVTDFDFTFNFDPTSQNFIRNVLSTDATLFTNGWNGHHVFLGETFENNVNRLGSKLIAWVGAIADEDAGKDFTNHHEKLAGAKTGWFIGSNASNYKRLFRFAALDEGVDFHKSHIIRIKDLRQATTVRPEASFTVEVARVGQRPTEYVEKFVNVTLNPDSPNYIAKKIGDLAQEWVPGTGGAEGKIVSTGSFTNQSNLIRVELARAGVNKTDLPLGFLGPAEIDSVEIAESDTDANIGTKWLWGANTLPGGTSSATVDGLFTGDTVTITWPTHQLSVANSYGAGNTGYPPSAMMGLSYAAQRGLEDFGDIGILKKHYDPHLDESASSSLAAYTFSLEHMVKDTNTGTYALDTDTTPAVTPFADLLADGVRQFAAPFFGGTDGVDIKWENPFNEAVIGSEGYAKYSLESAINQVADYYTSRYDLISMPGITNQGIMSKLIRQTEERGDALAIIDLPGIYQDAVDTGSENLIDVTDGSVAEVIRQVEGGTASSYAAAYYPNVRIADVSSGNGSVLMAPPSVAAIGAIAKSEALSQPWFAPAGFNRGGLAPLGGTGGANVVGTLEHLSKADRDNLYNVNINPIARFPATGDTVIFGQKTLQPEQTALDRINVRRMMIYLKKRIGGIADTFLFEQGVKATYDRFKATIEPILSEVRSQYGITEYKVILDETTTTPDLQDRNIMYAKVFVKPAKAIEYVVIDFVVTQSGVEF